MSSSENMIRPTSAPALLGRALVETHFTWLLATTPLGSPIGLSLAGD